MEHNPEPIAKWIPVEKVDHEFVSKVGNPWWVDWATEEIRLLREDNEKLKNILSCFKEGLQISRSKFVDGEYDYGLPGIHYTTVKNKDDYEENYVRTHRDKKMIQAVLELTRVLKTESEGE
jgi:hypothetical protein